MKVRSQFFALRLFIALAATVATLSIALSTAPLQAAKPPTHSAVTPESRPGDWMKLHDSFNERAKQGDVELVFLGDSITQGWADNDTWKKFYGRRHAGQRDHARLSAPQPGRLRDLG
jgi:beta-glucosidase